MADWLNVLLAGPCTITVYRDSEPVSTGFTLTTTGGVITLETPGAETHEWRVEVQPTFVTSAKLRMLTWDFTSLDGATASASLLGSQVASQALTLGPPVSPDPVEFTPYADTAVLTVQEPA
jgi:hypothetical protein